MQIKLKSYAKVNLGLCLHGKRNDGFHQLETIMHEVDLHDDITFSKSNQSLDSLTIDGCDKLDVKDNLIVRSLTLLREAYPALPTFNIHLVKRIPIGGGLGGGSSNAICILLEAAKYIDSIDSHHIDSIASKLGSDTNFFIKGGTAICRGRGEQVSLLKPKEFFLNLICPNIHCSTVEVFKNCSSDDYHNRSLQALWEKTYYSPQNDLETPCYKAYPKMLLIARELKNFAENLLLSGSGSTLYTIHNDEKSRNDVYDNLEQYCSKNKIDLLKTKSLYRD